MAHRRRSRLLTLSRTPASLIEQPISPRNRWNGWDDFLLLLHMKPLQTERDTMMRSSDEDTIDFLGHQIGITGRAFRRRLERNLAMNGSDLSAEHMMLLGFLSVREGVNQQEVTDHMFRDKTATTRWIDALEAKNLVARVPDKADRRQKLIFLTKQGRVAVEGLKKVIQATEDDALQGVDPQHITVCRNVLRQVRTNLDG